MALFLHVVAHLYLVTDSLFFVDVRICLVTLSGPKGCAQYVSSCVAVHSCSHVFRLNRNLFALLYHVSCLKASVHAMVLSELRIFRAGKLQSVEHAEPGENGSLESLQIALLPPVLWLCPEPLDH